MALWVDKYRPRELSELTYHKLQAEQVSKLVDTGDFPHLLICGPNGAGKRTRIQCILKELYGPGAENVKIITQPFQTSSGRKISLTSLSSNYHIELTPRYKMAKPASLLLVLVMLAFTTASLSRKSSRRWRPSSRLTSNSSVRSRV